MTRSINSGLHYLERKNSSRKKNSTPSTEASLQNSTVKVGNQGIKVDCGLDISGDAFGKWSASHKRNPDPVSKKLANEVKKLEEFYSVYHQLAALQNNNGKGRGGKGS